MRKFLFCALAAMVLPAILLAADNGDDYPVVFDKSQNYTHGSRRLNSVSLSSPSDGAQTLQLPVPLKVYSEITNGVFRAMPGETVTASFGFSGTWMNGFVYIDRGMDGSFEAVLNNDGTIPAGSDIMAFSYAEPVLGGGTGYNSKGERVTNTNVLNPPAFTVPADLAPGYYRMRYKVDWASIDPAGRAEDGNGIIRNGGAVCDVMVNVHAAESRLTVVSENGKLLAADGAALPAKVPFGKPLELKVVPAEGYALDFIHVLHGYGLDGEQYVHGVQQYADYMYPGYFVKDGVIAIPAECVDGDVVLTAYFVKAGNGQGGDGYALSFDKNAASSNQTNSITVNGVSYDIGGKAYYDFTASPVLMCNTKDVNVAFGAATGGVNYLYVDLNNDGHFTAVVDENGDLALSSELVACKGEKLYYQLPVELPDGVYRARVKVDNDDINPDGSRDMVSEGGFVADFLLNVVSGERKLMQYTVNGNIDAPGNTALPLVVTVGQGFDAVLRGAPGYKAEAVTVRHGHYLAGEQYVNGNRQWSEERVMAVNGKVTVSPEMVDGDVLLYVEFEPEEGCEWELVFSDEFNAEDYSQPADEKWMRCQRYSSTWNRWLSDSKEVVYLQGGDLVTRAIPNPDMESDPVPMITGGVKCNGRFGFTYGYVEARIFSNSWTGHFPAFWMMPEDQSAGWPDCGEIDIWEAIDNETTTYHTVHSNWTYDLGNKNNPRSSFSSSVPYDRYHTYGLLWDETSLTWFVDGKQIGKYSKSAVQSYLDQGQWPFDKHFHLILNQSVGNGSWAANADVSHMYETRFDWVRVYQKKGMKNTLGTVGVDAPVAADDADVSADKGVVKVVVPASAVVSVYDLSGRKVVEEHVDGAVSFPLQKGVYLVCGKKVVVK